MDRKKQTLALGLVGIPLLLLVLVGIAMTAFLSVNLISSGLRENHPANLALGTLLGALWLFMLVKTAKDRGRRPQRSRR